MITKDYNPSEHEVSFAQTIAGLGDVIAKKMAPLRLEHIEEDIHRDNPQVLFRFSDPDGDLHEIHCIIIQKADIHP